jgi:hypothetical protein
LLEEPRHGIALSVLCADLTGDGHKVPECRAGNDRWRRREADPERIGVRGGLGNA